MKNKDFIKIFIFLMFVSFTSFGCIVEKEYKEKYKEEDDKIFGTYNKDYVKKVDENSRLIILEVESFHAKRANVAIVNYLSNVGGELVSVNDITTSKSTINPVFGASPSEDGLNMGVGFVGGSKIDSKSQYTVLVPVDAKLADNLQERLDKYLWYYPWIELTS